MIVAPPHVMQKPSVAAKTPDYLTALHGVEYTHLDPGTTGEAVRGTRGVKHGELRGRIAQLALMAAYRASWPVMQRLVPLLASWCRSGESTNCG